EFVVVPHWLEVFLSTKFFTKCEEHSEHIKRECNMFCFDCSSNKPLCLYCVRSYHENHRTIQIRRSSYRSVLRVKDIKDELDTSGIQSYLIKKFDVIFVNKRSFDVHRNKATSKNCRHTFLCNICRRNISNSTSFCSLEYKVSY
ncbi:hypothetical protein V8G54_026762, partial [Vigna mungo]